MIKPKSWFINEVMSDEDLDERLCNFAAEMGKEVGDLRSLAMRYIKEIAADIDYTYLEVMNRFLGSTLRRIYEKFDVDTQGLKKAKELYAKGPVVLIPNHKSHVDYLVLSHLLHQNGMTVPHIAAGINMSFWPLGKIFRHCGAYFIKREFRDNHIYKAVLETYLKVLLQEGYCQEFFIEGGRSRTGKQRAPKLGMLSMLKRSAARAGMGELQLIPVTLTYDRVMEQKSYVTESEGGVKEAEKTKNLLGLTKYLKKRPHRHGSIYVRFGEPIAMKTDGDEKKVPDYAYDVSQEINRRSVVTPASLVATAILTGARRGISYDEFSKNAESIMDYFKHSEIELSEKFDTPFDQLLHMAASQLSANRLIQIHNGPLGEYISIEESKRMPLAFFKNGIVHYLVGVGLMSSIIISSERAGEHLTRDKLSSLYSKAVELINHEFAFERLTGSFDHALDYLTKIEAVGVESGDTFKIQTGGMKKLEIFAAHTKPYLETLLITLLHIQNLTDKEVEQSDLVNRMQKSGNDLLLLGKIHHREAINKFDLKNTLRTLVSKGILTIKEPEVGKKRKTVYFKTSDSAPCKKLQVALEKLL